MKKANLIVRVFLITGIIVSSCGSSNQKTSNEGSVINEVTIGRQVWMTENLNVEKFRNGDSIPEAKTDEEWKKAGESGQPAWSYYDNDPKNGEIYGKLYNWYAVNDPRGLAPEGWHISSEKDWAILRDFLRDEDQAGVKLKSINFWAYDNRTIGPDEPPKPGNGTNESGFSGLPGGMRRIRGGFGFMKYSGWWWSTNEHEKYSAWSRTLSYHSGSMDRQDLPKSNGLSVRCVKN